MLDRLEIKQSLDHDKRVKYDPSKIVADEGMSTSERRTRSKKGKGSSLTSWQTHFYRRGTAEIAGLAKAILSAVSPEDSQDEVYELPPEVVLNIGEKSSQRPVFITDTPYRPKPGDEAS